MCNLYSITTNQAAIAALFRVVNQYVGNLPPMPGVFPDYPAPVVRNAGADRELIMMRWGMPPPPRTGGPPVTNIRNRLSSIEKLGNGRDKLRWRERLGQEDAVGYAMGWPFGCMAAGHIDNWEFRVDLSGSLRHLPTVHYAAQLDVGHKRSIFSLDAH